MRTWFNVKALADTAVEVSIYDEIGAWGVSAKDFIDGIKPYKGKPMTLAINSPGGDVFAGIAIYNALRMHGAEVTVRVMGVAASAASLIAMAGSKIVMPENTFMMVHNPWTFALGNADELRDMADMLDKVGASLTATYVSRTGKTEDEIKALLAAETWMTAQEAVDAGFADEVEAVLKLAAKFDLDRLPEQVRAAFAEPEPAPTPASTPEAKPLFEQIRAAATAQGFERFAELWALDPTIESVDALAPRMAAAREIAATCAFAKMPDLADAFVRSNASVRDVRAKLTEMKAQADEQSAIDTAPRNKTTPASSTRVEFSYRQAYKQFSRSK